MLEITYADDEGVLVEIEITGTLEELREIEKALNDLAQGRAKEAIFDGRMDFVPKFNDGWIKELILISGEGNVTIIGEPQGSVVIEGSPEKLDELSGYFCFEEDDKYPEHHHCEWRQDHPCLSPASIPLVISIVGTEEEIAEWEGDQD